MGMTDPASASFEANSFAERMVGVAFFSVDKSGSPALVLRS
jgi:hypothetical protein